MELAANIAFVLSLFCALLFVLRTCLGSLARPSIVVATHLGLALFLLMLVGLLRVWMLWLVSERVFLRLIYSAR